MRNTVDPMPIYDDEFCKSTTLSFLKEDVSILIPGVGGKFLKNEMKK